MPTTSRVENTTERLALTLLAGSKLVPLVLPGLRTIHFGPGVSLYGENPPKTQLALLFTEDPVIGDIASIYGEISPFQLSK